MIAIKLLLVPLLLAAVTLAGRRWGQNVAGWLGSFPIVAGPILLVLSLEQGAAFGAAAAQFALAGIAATMAFFVVYARLARRTGWGISMLGALFVWLAAVAGLMQLPQTLPFALGAALLSLAVSARAMGAAPTPSPARSAGPSTAPSPAAGPHPLELPARMAAGAALTVTSSALAARFGADASGYAALFPVVGATAAGFNHATSGAAAARAFLRGMTRGMWSVAVFCGVLTLTLARWPVAAAFAAAVAATVAMHATTRPRAR
jgi:hypothetical protein